MEPMLDGISGYVYLLHVRGATGCHREGAATTLYMRPCACAAGRTHSQTMVEMLHVLIQAQS